MSHCWLVMEGDGSWRSWEWRAVGGSCGLQLASSRALVARGNLGEAAVTSAHVLVGNFAFGLGFWRADRSRLPRLLSLSIFHRVNAQYFRRHNGPLPGCIHFLFGVRAVKRSQPLYIKRDKMPAVEALRLGCPSLLSSPSPDSFVSIVMHFILGYYKCICPSSRW